MSGKLDEPHAPNVCRHHRPTLADCGPVFFAFRPLRAGAPAQAISDGSVIFIDFDAKETYGQKIETDKLSGLGYTHVKLDLCFKGTSVLERRIRKGRTKND